MSEWIKCSERLPDPNDLVFVDSANQAGIGFINSDLSCSFASGPLFMDSKEGWQIDGGFENGDHPATQWQPLPPPPAD